MTHPTIPAPEHRHRGGSTGGPGENSAECACGVTFDGFDTHAEAVAQLEQHIDDAVHTRRADQLVAGDWVAMLLDGDPWETRQNAEVLATFPYTDEVENARVLVVAKSATVVSPAAVRLLADQPVRVLTADELDAIRERAERAQRIAGIRAFADWLEANPAVPMPWQVQADEHLSIGDGTEIERLAKVRQVAAMLDVEADERLTDRTEVEFKLGDFVTYRLIAWHKGGRPVEPVEDERCGTCGESLREIGLGTLDHVPGEACAPVDDLGYGYSRVDDDPQVVRPHSPRVPLHTGAVVDGGALVDETQPLIHVRKPGSERVACGEFVDAITSFTGIPARADCVACLDAVRVEPVSGSR